MAIIDDILDYSKIEAGKLSLERGLLDMVTCLSINDFYMLTLFKNPIDFCCRDCSETSYSKFL